MSKDICRNTHLHAHRQPWGAKPFVELSFQGPGKQVHKLPSGLLDSGRGGGEDTASPFGCLGVSLVRLLVPLWPRVSDTLGLDGCCWVPWGVP